MLVTLFVIDDCVTVLDRVVIVVVSELDVAVALVEDRVTVVEVVDCDVLVADSDVVV